MPKDNNTTSALKIKSSAQLREFLLDTMVGVSEGRISNEQAETICELSNEVHKTLLAELRVLQALPLAKMPPHEPSDIHLIGSPDDDAS